MDGWMVLVVVDFCALGGRCARRDWHTGKRKGEGEGGKAKILGFGPWSLVLRIFGHHCTALVHREAVFKRKFGADLELAKTTISKEECTAMSHPRMMLRAGFGSAV